MDPRLFSFSAFLFLALPLQVQSAELELDLRYQNTRTLASELQQTVSLRGQLTPGILARGVGRISESANLFERYGYGAAVEFRPLSWLAAQVQLSHVGRIPQSISSSSVLAYLGWEPGGNAFRFWLRVGYKYRFAYLGGLQPIPMFPDVDYADTDLAVDVGFSLGFSKWLIWTRVATFEVLEVFNLNHPYVEAGLRYYPDREWSVQLYSRYQILLGFGLLDTFAVGANVTLPLGS